MHTLIEAMDHHLNKLRYTAYPCVNSYVSGFKKAMTFEHATSMNTKSKILWTLIIVLTKIPINLFVQHCFVKDITRLVVYYQSTSKYIQSVAFARADCQS